MDEHWDVVVVGAGVAGLTAAATAAASGAATLVIEAHQPGGRASTDERGAYRFNRGAHALYGGGAADAVLARLGVAGAVVGSAPPVQGARGRLGDRVGILPSGLLTLARTRLLRARSKPAVARMLSGIRRWRPEDVAGLTIGEWLDGFDLPDDGRAFARLLVRTTSYLHDEDTASADVPVTMIRQAYGAGVRYLHGGWASLVAALTAAARRDGSVIVPGAAARALSRRGDGWEVDGPGLAVSAAAVVLAAGTPPASAALLDAVPPAWARLGPPVEAACLDIGVRARLAHPVLLGLDRPLYLIDHAASAAGLAPAGHGLVHVLRYLGLGEDIPADRLRGELEEHAALAGVDRDCVDERRFLRRMTVAGAAPTPDTGGLAGRPGVDSTGLDGVYVAGDWVGPTGWLADAALASGEAAGLAAARHAARATTPATNGSGAATSVWAQRPPAGQDVPSR